MVGNERVGSGLDFEVEMRERRARIRARLEELKQEARAAACAPSACSGCSSAGCHPAAEMGLPMAEAYEVC
jgi:hypothetical protein